MAHPTIHSSIQDLETTDCLTKLQHSSIPLWNLSGSEKADLNLLKPEAKVAICQTPRESQTRSPDYLKKLSMNQHAQQNSATSQLRGQYSTQQNSATIPQHVQYSAQQISATSNIRDMATEGHDNTSLTHQGSLFGNPTRKDPQDRPS